MSVKEIEKNLFLVDAQTAGIRNFIASYVLTGKRAIIVESGPTSSVPNLLSALKETDTEVEDVAYVVVSHIHLDHGGGVGTLLRSLPEAKVLVHPRGVAHLAHPEKLWEQSKMVLGSITDLYGAPEPVPENRIIAAADGMVLDVGNGVGVRVIETLGHASHHLSYCELLNRGVFPGDAAGIYLNEIDVIVPTTPPPFRMDIALASIDKLIGFKPEALYYSHFGEARDAIAKLSAYVRQLRTWAEIAKQAVNQGEDLQTIGKRIIEKDAELRKAMKYVEGHPVLGETVLNESVQGVVDFVQKFGVPQ